jgi:CheY-like chemotaxis protein
VQLILTDYSMPEMNGYDLLVEVKVGSMYRRNSSFINYLVE